MNFHTRDFLKVSATLLAFSALAGFVPPLAKS